MYREAVINSTSTKKNCLLMRERKREQERRKERVL